MGNESANLWLIVITFGEKSAEWGYYLGLQNPESKYEAVIYQTAILELRVLSNLEGDNFQADETQSFLKQQVVKFQSLLP